MTQNHNVLAEKYVDPMAEYLVSAFGISIADGYALAWSGLSDAKVFAEAAGNFEFTMSNGNKISKTDIILNSADYKEQSGQPGSKGTPICNIQ